MLPFAELIARFHETFAVAGTLIGVLLMAGALVAVAYGARWRTAAEVEAANAHAWEETAKRLGTRVEHLERRLLKAEARVAELEGLPDVAAIHAALAAHDEAVAAALTRHDDNAEARVMRLTAGIRAGQDEMTKRIVDAIHELRGGTHGTAGGEAPGAGRTA